MIKNLRNYIFEYLLVTTAIFLSITGFWNIYFGLKANPTVYQNLHVITASIWQLVLLYQLSLIGRKQALNHRNVGLSILFLGPLLFATTALLSVHSAHKGVVSGEGDILIVQNVMGTLYLGLLILAAFIWRKRRKLHGAFLLSTVLIFIGIALFFSLIGFVPQFRIEGPETFDRFGKAAGTAAIVCFFIGLFFFLKDRKNGWPILFAGSSFILNEFINTFLKQNDLIQLLTISVGSLNPLATFLGSFIVLLILLILTGITNRKPAANLAP